MGAPANLPGLLFRLKPPRDRFAADNAKEERNNETWSVRVIRYKGRAAVYGEVWYDEEPPPDSGVDIIVYRQQTTPIPGARATAFLSLVVDLAGPEDGIMNQFGKDCRYKIRRAASKDGLHMEFISDARNRLHEFRAFYDAFARQKSLQPSDWQWLNAACDARQLVLTSASRSGETLVWHAFVMSGKAAWLQYTGSCFRDRDNDYRAVVGRANRWLHWSEMLRFKQLGITRYDWGGLFEDESAPERAGINRFKKEFGGRPVRTYDCTVPVTPRGRIWLPLRDIWRLRKSVREIAQRHFPATAAR